jgi:hypothetical protein
MSLLKRTPRTGLAALVGIIAVAALLAWLLGAFDSSTSRSGALVTSREERSAESRSAPSPPRGRPVTVNVDVSHPGAPIPSDFLGLSFEATATHLIASYSRGGNLAALMRSLGGGVIRLGGVSVDRRVSWSPNGVTRPSWSTVGITRQDLAAVAALGRETGWSVLLAVDLAHYDPAAAAQEVAAAHSLLGARLAGVEIGNEPDRYAREGLRDSSWSFNEYAREFDAYSSAIERAAPGVPIAAPDASSGIPPLPWVADASALHPVMLTDHYYPLSSCGGTEVMVSELLSPLLREHENAMLARLLAIQRASAIPVRIDETNSISCRGQPGLSDSFASALWATDWTARAMSAGIAGLNFHDLLSQPGAYSPLVLQTGSSELHANPDWYALLLTAPLVGARPVAASVQPTSSLTAAAFVTERHGSHPSPQTQGLRLLLVDFDPPSARPLRVRLRVPSGFTGGGILRLSGPSATAQAHVKLGGSEVRLSGAWSPRLPLPRVYDGGGSLALEMPPNSAALVTLPAHTESRTH